MKHLRIVFSLLLLTSTSRVFAQTDTTRTITSGFHFILPFEAPFLDVGNLDRELIAQGYPEFDYPVVAPGFGVQSQTNRLIFSFSFNKFTNKKEDLNSNYEIGYSTFSFLAGRDFLRKASVSLYPYIGYKTSELTYVYRDKVNTTFGGYLSGNFREKEMTNARRNLDVGLGLAYQKVLQFGIRSGIFIPIQKESWKIHNNKVALADIPGVKRNFYVTLFIGLGFIDQTKVEKPEEKTGYDWDTQTASLKAPIKSKKGLKRFLP